MVLLKSIFNYYYNLFLIFRYIDLHELRENKCKLLIFKKLFIEAILYHPLFTKVYFIITQFYLKINKQIKKQSTYL